MLLVPKEDRAFPARADLRKSTLPAVVTVKSSSSNLSFCTNSLAFITGREGKLGTREENCFHLLLGSNFLKITFITVDCKGLSSRFMTFFLRRAINHSCSNIVPVPYAVAYSHRMTYYSAIKMNKLLTHD